jgi:hypothetical protein
LSEKKDIIKLEKSEVFLRLDDIVQINFHDNCEVDKKDCEDIISAYDQLLQNKKYPLLHFLGSYTTFTKNTREFSVTERGTQYSAAEAYIYSSLAHKILANFYIKINKPPVPTKFFTNEKEAVAWLNEFL